jgi:L-lactate dehydrogenase complex protein LldG
MKESVAKKNILKKIKQALGTPVPVPFVENDFATPNFKPSRQDLDIEFAENFTGLQGRFSFCENEKELVRQLETLFAKRDWKNIFLKDGALGESLKNNGLKIEYSQNLEACDAAITSCEYLVARTGSIVLSTAQQSGRTVSVYAPVHICVAYANQLVYDIKDGLALLQTKYANKLPSLITFATGPSRTADIEKTLVTGVHGPKEVFCFLLETSNP